MAGIGQDVKLAVRGLLTRPRFAAVAIVSLALGIGANAAVFSLVDTVLFRPLPVHAPEELVSVQFFPQGPKDEDPDAPSLPDFQDLREDESVFDGLLAHGGFTFSVRTTGSTERITGEFVSANFFDVLGVPPVLGRGFEAGEDDRPEPVAVISHRLWQRLFLERSALGESLVVNGKSVSVIGVAPPEFVGIDVGYERDLWIPFPMLEPLWPRVAEFFSGRGRSGLPVVGRLKEGVTVEEADAVIRARARQLALAYPDTNGGTTARVVPIDETRVRERGDAVSYFAILLSVAGLVFLIACANVASLRTVELLSREGEVATRRALGATRWRLLRQLLVENGVLYAAAFVASFGVALLSTRLLERLTLFRVPMTLELGVDTRVVLLAAVLAFAGSFLFSLTPLVWPILGGERAELPGRGTTQQAARSRLLGALVAVQMALSCGLLVGTGLLGRSLANAYAVDPGYRLDNVLFVSVDLPSMAFRYDETRTQQFFRDVLDRVQTIPGVRDAAWSADIPFERMRIMTMYVPEAHPEFAKEDPEWLQADADIVTPDYLRTMGIPLVEGRDLSVRDDERAPGAVLVNETMARTEWPREPALGKRIRVWSRAGVTHDTYEVVGIVKDVRYSSLMEEPGPYVYYPVAQRFFQNMNLHVYVDDDPLSYTSAIRAAIAAIDADLPIFNARELSEERSIALSRQTTAATLLGLSGALALFLTTLGTYSVNAYVVSRRTPEIGLRMALGANARDIERLILERGAPRIAAGVFGGLVASAWISAQLEALLLGVGPYDAAAYAASVGVLVAAAFIAGYVPARRASSIEPSIALRHD